MAASRLALLCLLGLTLLLTNGTAQDASLRCRVPSWHPDFGDNPFDLYRGKVLLVALVKGYCQYCMGQAMNLELLKHHMQGQGYGDIAMVLVNGGDRLSRNHYSNLALACNLPSYQDTADNVMYDDIFHGDKDDFVVFDRCGHRVAYIPHPYSYLGHNITERVLRSVHRGRHGCHCLLDNPVRNPYEMMYGDQPASDSGSSGGLMGQILSADSSSGNGELEIECATSDRMCRRYNRRMRNGRLRHHGGGRGGHRGHHRDGSGIGNNGGHHGGHDHDCTHSVGMGRRRFGRWNRRLSDLDGSSHRGGRRGRGRMARGGSM